ncbi:uncharacterized protein LOC131801181 [Musca domestica]|uniref:Uncharacterized protein LOC131801181 n=1 Tax=Musca domestica TaxID=7370 RepID=A0ABM3UPA9_MUSDO|nr:uncharacterized protein LOC131801181 [Musca domestica]
MDFYNHIQHKLAILNQKCGQENRLDEVDRNIQTGLKTFITRLPIHMRTVLCALKPQSMEEALHELSSAGFLNNEKKKDKPQPSPQQQHWQPKIMQPRSTATLATNDNAATLPTTTTTLATKNNAATLPTTATLATKDNAATLPTTTTLAAENCTTKFPATWIATTLLQASATTNQTTASNIISTKA